LVETSGQKGQGESVPLARRIFAAAGVALGFATEGASGVRQRILPSRKQPESQPHKARVASRSVISSAPHFRAV
jgi:hypothetical protein